MIIEMGKSREFLNGKDGLNSTYPVTLGGQAPYEYSIYVQEDDVPTPKREKTDCAGFEKSRIGLKCVG